MNNRIRILSTSDVHGCIYPLSYATNQEQNLGFAKLKTLIDRCCAKYTKIKNKDFYLILTAADSGKAIFKRAISGVQGLVTDCLDNCEVKKVLCAGGLWHKGEVKDTKYITQAYNLGKNI